MGTRYMGGISVDVDITIIRATQANKATIQPMIWRYVMRPRGAAMQASDIRSSLPRCIGHFLSTSHRPISPRLPAFWPSTTSLYLEITHGRPIQSRDFYPAHRMASGMCCGRLLSDGGADTWVRTLGVMFLPDQHRKAGTSPQPGTYSIHSEQTGGNRYRRIVSHLSPQALALWLG